MVTSDIGDTQPPNVVFGALWAPIARKGFLDFEHQMKELRLKHKCWGKLQWKKTIGSQSIFDFYRESIDLFIDTDLLAFNSIIVDKDVLHHHAKYLGSNINATKASFVYLLLSRGSRRYCSAGDSLHILLDRGEHKPAEIQKIRDDIERYYLKERTSFSVNHIQQCDAHIVSTIQIADFIIGALSRRINNTAASTQHEALTAHLEKRLGQSLLYSTPQSYKKLNVWKWHPGSPFANA
ncbi:MAG TPA: DUF3800 domain-containing protein [Candidatus Saccharimonadia bacterium]|nr:DUF3800 domain-containing protein [Candidatus Saccharimonadia bacterium]